MSSVRIDLERLKTYCLYTPYHAYEQRRRNAVERLKRFSPVMFAGIVGPDPHRGCTASVLALMKHIEAVGQFPALVLEDDAALTNLYTPTITVPADFDAVYLGYTTQQSVNVSALPTDCEGIYRADGLFTTHAVIVGHVAAARWIAREAQIGLIRGCTIDTMLAMSQRFHNVYATSGAFFYQQCKKNGQVTLASLVGKEVRPA